MEFDQTSFRVPLYFSPNQIARFDFCSPNSPLIRPVDDPIWLTQFLALQGYAFHKDLINHTLTKKTIELSIQSGLICAAQYPREGTPRTILYWHNSTAAEEMLTHQTNFVIEQMSEQASDQNFTNLLFLQNDVNSLAGLIYGRVTGRLEEVTDTQYRFFRPPFYFETANVTARDIVNREREYRQKKDELAIVLARCF